MVALIKLPAVLVVRRHQIWIYCEENAATLWMLSEQITELRLNFLVIITEVLNPGPPWHCKENRALTMPPYTILFLVFTCEKIMHTLNSVATG